MALSNELGLVLTLFSAFFGACVGSFLNVCIYRLPREGLSPTKPRRSFCPTCGKEIAWYDNLPIASWLLLGGRCRACRAPIRLRYLFVEGLTALIFLFLARRYLCGEEMSWGAYLSLAALVSALIVAAFIDVDLRVIPDEITLPGMALAPFLALLVPELHSRPEDSSLSWLLFSLEARLDPLSSSLPEALRHGALLAVAVGLLAVLFFFAGLLGYAGYWRMAHREDRRPLSAGYLAGVLGGAAGAMAVLHLLKPETVLTPWAFSFWAALAGMLAGSSLVFFVGVIFSRIFRKPAMGFGDVKLMGLLGAFTGWVGVLAGFFIACFLGAIVGIFILIKYHTRYLPFGPFLSAGSLLMVFWPEGFRRLLAWYIGLF
jgi:leader peptidase (prepilin peptidase)/N-methyltransferase